MALIAKLVQSLHTDGAPFDHIAILFRTNAPARSLEEYLQAAATAAELRTASATTRTALEASQRKVETLQAERSRAFLRGLCAIDAGLRTTFRALCKHGDCAFEYASQPTILFAEGVRLSVRLPQGEWTRFEGLSGGQQALVAVALNLALREADGAPLVLFDEIDAALDTQRVHALAQYVQRKGGAQTVFVSHRLCSCIFFVE